MDKCQARPVTISGNWGDGQASPDKNVNFRYTTAAFTLSQEPRALLCCANLPGDWALYAISVPRIKSGAGLAHSFALRLPSPACRQTGTPLHGNALAFG
jgi:hypothetical protein